MYVENADDLNRKYGQSYAILNGKVAFIHEFGQLSDNSIRIFFAYKGDAQNQLLDVDADKVPIEPIYFDAKFVNVFPFGEKNRQGIYPIVGTLVRRRADRQWKRGICNTNTWIHSPVGTLYSTLGHGNPTCPLSFNMMEQLVSSTYPSFNEALKFCEKNVCVAFDSMYCVMLSSVSPNKYLLASQYGFIGEAIEGHVWIMHDHSQQEFKDFIRRSGQTITMEVSTCPTLKMI